MNAYKRATNMAEYKLHANRQFGTEQFSVTATINSESNTLSDVEVTNTISNLDNILFSQLVSVDTRSIREKEYLASQRNAQFEADNKLREALDKFKPTEETTETTEDVETPAEDTVVQSNG